MLKPQPLETKAAVTGACEHSSGTCALPPCPQLFHQRGNQGPQQETDAQTPARMPPTWTGCPLGGNPGTTWRKRLGVLTVTSKYRLPCWAQGCHTIRKLLGKRQRRAGAGNSSQGADPGSQVPHNQPRACPPCRPPGPGPPGSPASALPHAWLLPPDGPNPSGPRAARLMASRESLLSAAARFGWALPNLA